MAWEGRTRRAGPAWHLSREYFPRC